MKKWACFFLMLLLGGLAWANQQGYIHIPQPESLVELREKRQILADQELFYDARELGEHIYRQTQDLEDLLLLGSYSEHLFDQQAAKDWYQEAIKQFPKDLRAYDHLLGLLEGKQEKASLLYQKAEVFGEKDLALQAIEAELVPQSLDQLDIIDQVEGYLMAKGAQGVKLLTLNGQEVFQETYDAIAYAPDEALFSVLKNGQAHLLDEEGNKRRVPAQDLDWLGPLEERTLAQKEGQFAYLNQNLEPLTAFCYDRASRFSTEGLAAVKTSEGWAFIGRDFKPKGQEVFEDLVMDQAGQCFQAQRCLVQRGGQWWLLDQDLKLLNAGQTWLAVTPLSLEGDFLAQERDGWHLYDANGRRLLEEGFEAVSRVVKGHFFVRLDAHHWQVVNRYGFRGQTLEVNQVTFIGQEGLIKGSASGGSWYWHLFEREDNHAGNTFRGFG